MTNATDNRLCLLVERVERIEEEISGLREDRKDVFAEAKAVGYDVRIIRQVIARRRVLPEHRVEADAMLEIYEAALGGHAPDPAVSPATAQRDLAIAILSEQIEGIQDAEQAEKLAEHLRIRLDIRAEIASLRQDESARTKLAAGDGFDKNAFTALVRWIEKCAKHGADTMRAGEALFHLYRGTVEGRDVLPSPDVTLDPALKKLIGGTAQKSTKTQSATDAWLSSGLGG